MEMPHPPTLQTYFVHRITSAAVGCHGNHVLTDLWGKGLFTFFFFSSLLLHDDCLSAIARMELCDTA